MTEPMERVSLFRRDDDDYVLERRDSAGTFSAIALSEANLRSLQTLIQRECARLLEKRSTLGVKAQGVEPIVAVPVRSFVLVHRSEIYLTLEDNDGNSYRFLFRPTDEARIVGTRLIEGANEIAAATPRRS
jgi:hypothetical protein